MISRRIAGIINRTWVQTYPETLRHLVSRQTHQLDIFGATERCAGLHPAFVVLEDEAVPDVRGGHPDHLTHVDVRFSSLKRAAS
jgi:hypothetical protein